MLPHIQSGALAALAATRPGVLPDLPSMADAGFKGFDAGLWFGMFAPAGTPREIVDKLSVGINEALKMDDVIAALRKQGSSRSAARPTNSPATSRARSRNGRGSRSRRG